MKKASKKMPVTKKPASPPGTVPLSSVKLNPNNPRTITEEDFNKLVTSLHEFPEMMELRPMVVDKNGYVIGGNMRLRALQQLKIENIPASWVKHADELTAEQVKRFVAADNLSFGKWDFDALANEYTIEELTHLGFNEKELLAEWPSQGDIENPTAGPPDMECQPREHWDYVVFMFDSRSDWLQLCQRMGLQQVHTSQHSEHKIGLGRILKGQRLLDLLSAGHEKGS